MNNNLRLFDFNRSVQATGRNALDDFRPTSLVEHQRGEIIASAYLPQLTEYLLRLTFTVRFMAAPDEQRELLRLAERTIVTTVYHEFLLELHRLKLAIASGDREKAMEIAGEMTDRIVSGEIGIGHPVHVP